MLERDMQNLVRMYPAELLDEPGLVFQGEEVRLGDFRFDLVFRDRQGATLLVELQRGRLDRTHLYKVLDYADRYREANPGISVECMVVANEISGEYKERLQARGIDYREISLVRFAEFGRARGYVAIGDAKHTVASAAGTQEPRNTQATGGTGGPETPGPGRPAPPPAARYVEAASAAYISDPQTALKQEFARDSADFIPKSEFTRRYGTELKLWSHNYFEAMGFPLPTKPTAKDFEDATRKVQAKVREAGSLVTILNLRPGFALKITLDNSFPFGAAKFQIGFVLTCLVFGWLDDTKSKLAELGVKSHHFYDLERRYRLGEPVRVAPGLVVEAFAPT